MKTLVLIAVLCFVPSLRAQTVTLSRRTKAENLTTKDSLSAVKPCAGITEELTLSDSIVVVARTPVNVSVADSLALSDSVAIAFTFTFPQRCALSMVGNVVTCAIAAAP